MKDVKRISLLAVPLLTMLFALFFTCDVEAAIAEKTQIGTTGVYWEITDEGELRITGSGDPEINVFSAYEIPWNSHRAKIKSAYIEKMVEPKSMAYWFQGCTQLTIAPEIPNTVTLCLRMFHGCTSLTEVPNIPSSANCKQMFIGCTSLTTVPEIPNSVTDCSGMFQGCTSLKTIPNIPNSTTTCENMFYGCTSLTEVPNISSSANCKQMFYGCTSLTEAPEISNGITNCYYMFYNCTSLTKAPEIPYGVTDCTAMFCNCEKLTIAPEIPSSVTDCSSMFSNCTSLTAVPNISAGANNCQNMFSNCTSLTTVPEIPNNVTDCQTMFQGCTSLKTIPNIPNRATLCTNMFSDCTSLTTVPEIPNGVTRCAEMFSNCYNLKGDIKIYCAPISYNLMFDNAGQNTDGITILYSDKCSFEMANKLAATGQYINSIKYTLPDKVNEIPDIVTSPNAEVIFECPINSSELTYQWYIADTKITAGQVINGATGPILTIESNDVTIDLDGKYFYCVIKENEEEIYKTNYARLGIAVKPNAPTFSANILSNSWSNKAIELNLTGSEINGSTENVGYKYSIDSGITWVDYSETINWDTDTTQSVIMAKAYNKIYGNTDSDIARFIIKYDATEPIIESVDVSVEDKEITINATDATSGVVGYALKPVNVQTFALTEQEVEWVEDSTIKCEYGSYVVMVKDAAGNIATYNSNVDVDDPTLSEYITEHNVDVVYDGKEHAATVECEIASIKYSLSESNYDMDTAPSYTNAGTYTVYYKASADGYIDVTGSITVNIKKADGKATLNVDDIEYGKDLIIEVTSGTNGSDYTLYYKSADAEDSTYTTDVPKAVGSYVAKVVFAETDNYKEVSATDVFEITQKVEDNKDDNTEDDETGDTPNSGNTDKEEEDKPVEKPAVNDENTIKKVKVGDVFTVKSMKYKVTKVTSTGGEVSLIGTTKKKSKLTSLNVGKTVKIDGKTYKITSIGNKAFKGYTKLNKITIGDNVKTVGKEVFSGCNKVTAVKIGKSATTISSKAFYKCTKLKSITIKSKKLKTIGSKAITSINKKCKIIVPSSKVKDYKKLFKSKTGFKKTMKIKK